MKKVTKVMLLIIIAVVGLVLSGCNQKDVNELEVIKKRGKLIVGTSPDYPPYEFIDVETGEVIGFDLEIAKEIAKDLGVELVIKEMSFNGLLAALTTGNVDIVLAGMTPTPERMESVDFSDIYYTAVQAVIVHADNKDTISSLDDLVGKQVGVQKGTIQAEIAAEIEGAKVKELGKITDLVMELKFKNIDALIVELPVAESYVKNNSDLYLTSITFEEVDGGSAVAVKKNSPELLTEINKTLKRLMDENLIDKFVTEATNKVNADEE